MRRRLQKGRVIWLLFEDGVVAGTFALRFLAIVASRVRLVALEFAMQMLGFFSLFQ